MAVVFDGETVKTVLYGAATSITVANQTTAGSNRVGIVGGAGLNFGSVTSATWAGSAMTLLGETTTGGAHAWAYYIKAPPTSASNVVVNFSGNCYGGAGASGWKDVDQTTSIGTPVTANAATVEVSSATGEMVVSSHGGYNVSTTPGAGQTSLYGLNNAGGQAGGSYEAGASTVTMSFGGGDIPCIVAVSLKAAGGGAVIIRLNPLRLNQSVNRASTF